MARFFIVTGESSGDRLGALLGHTLRSRHHIVQGWGGEQMEKAKIPLTQNIASLRIMGWTNVIIRLPKLIYLLSKCKKDILSFNPDTLILVDFGSFNLRIARWAKARGYKVIYYSPPKVWATRSGRIELLRQYCDQIIVLFPFERDFFHSFGIKALYFGHPLAGVIAQHSPDPGFKKRYRLDDRPILALLPGSRKSEVRHTLPIYLKTARRLSEYQVCVSCAHGMLPTIKQICTHFSLHLTIIEKDYYDLLHLSDFAIVTSGTATLEAALFRVPQVVGYKTSYINYRIAKALIKTKYISLVNLIADREIVSELIQDDLHPDNLYTHIIRKCRLNAKSILEMSYNGIINDLFVESCLFDTVVAISGEET